MFSSVQDSTTDLSMTEIVACENETLRQLVDTDRIHITKVHEKYQQKMLFSFEFYLCQSYNSNLLILNVFTALWKNSKSNKKTNQIFRFTVKNYILKTSYLKILF